MARTLWLDAYDYVVALLRSGEDPWLEPDSIGIFCDEAIKLLGADYLLLPLAPFLQSYLREAGEDGEARAEALDDAVGEGELLETIGRAMTALAVSSGGAKVVPVLPGPAVIGGDDTDALDIASMALGDILRAIMLLGQAEHESATYCFPAATDVSRLGKAGCQTLGSQCFSGDAMPDSMAEQVRVQIPADTPPEFVLERLVSLRSKEA